MYPSAYIKYLVHFHGDRDYFECHEILEEYWKKEDKTKEDYWVGLIQIAVSLYHHRRRNYAGARKLMEKALKIVLNHQTEIESLGLHYESLIEMIKKRIKDIQQCKEYVSIQLPIVDQELLNTCKEGCRRSNLIWGNESNLLDNSLVHKHTIRDRSTIIAEREKSKLYKQKRD